MRKADAPLTRSCDLYALRLQIEETFRNEKGHLWRLGLCHARSRDVNRLEVLLLVATLATLVSVFSA